ncbi:MAG TPA: flagellar biosynthetic protein FliP, partial [Planctomycetes bacterium]|nr:flagellar biosynthetic protein FliP [Planctomycetota bacterium]
MNLKRRILLCMLSTLIILVINAPIVHAGEATTDIVDRVLGGEPENVGVSLRLLLVTTVVAIAPALLLLTTSFTRIIVVLGFVRR